jgi:hypothetical protein
MCPVDLRTEDGQTVSSALLESPGGSGAPLFTPGGSSPAVAVSQALQQTLEVGPTGRLTWIGVFPFAIGGGTAANGDVMEVQATLDGSPVAGLSVTGTLEAGALSLTVIGSVGALVPGSSHAVGILATDSTTSAHTFTWGPGSPTLLSWAP